MVGAEKLHRIRMVVGGGEGSVNFVRVERNISFTSGILKCHLNALVLLFLGFPWLFIRTSILLFKCSLNLLRFNIVLTSVNCSFNVE